MLALAPDSGTVLAILTNHQDGGEIGAALDQIVQKALGAHEVERIAVVLDPTEYLGTYRSPLLDVEVAEKEDGLQLESRVAAASRRRTHLRCQTRRRMPVAFFERDRMFVPDGPAKGTEAEFLRGPDGRIEWFRFGGRVMQPLR